ncbi:MAG: Abi-alpha family protein [Acetobacterium sp.]|uniref:Abi-alpha family protein n=1 Tax=Acetobacterium sp. TaxID=1872094 RepID=UPI003242E9C3
MCEGLELIKMVTALSSTAGKAIDFASVSGIPESIKNALGILDDKISEMKLNNQINFLIRVKKKLDDIGYPYILKPIELKLTAHLLEATSLETNDFLQEMWVNLLINSSIEETGIYLNRTFMDILERLSPLEAKILIKIYELPFEETENRGVLTIGLPEKVTIVEDNYKRDDRLENEPIKLALSNLLRLGCISQRDLFAPDEIFEIVKPTLLGKRFVESCTLDL